MKYLLTHYVRPAMLASALVALALPADAASRERGRGQTQAATTQIQLPACDALERLAAQVDSGQQTPINRWVDPNARSGLSLTSALLTQEFEQIFGQPMLRWTRADVSALNPVLNNCMKLATKAKRFEQQKQLIELRRVLQYHLSQPLNAVNRARADVATQLEALSQLPASTEKLNVTGKLSRLAETVDLQQVLQIRRDIETLRHSAATPGRLVAASLQNLPQDEADKHLADIIRMRDEQLEEVLAGLNQQLKQASVGLAGLVTINSVINTAERDLTDIAPQASLNALQTQAKSAQEGLWQQLEQEITGLSKDDVGSAQLDAMTQSAEYGQLEASDRARLDTLLTAWREEMASVSVAGAIEQLHTYPHTLAGLGQMVTFARAHRAKLGQQHAPTAKQRFEAAYAEAHGARISAVESEFEDFLDDVPQSRQGVMSIKSALAEIDAPRRGPLYRAGALHAQRMVAAITREERKQECQQALPNLELDEDDGALPVMGFSGETLVLADLLCDAALAGNQVHDFETPGLFGSDYLLEVTGRDGIYRTYTLHLVPVGPDQQALVGVSVKDPTSEQPLDVQQWRSALGKLLPANKAGRAARCDELMSRPEAQLSANEKVEAMGCVLGGLLSP